MVATLPSTALSNAALCRCKRRFMLLVPVLAIGPYGLSQQCDRDTPTCKR